MFGIKDRLQDAAAESPAAGASPSPAPTPAAPGVGQPAAPASAPAGTPSALTSGAPTALQSQTADPNPHAWLPEKHRVYREDKTLDIEASARKNAEAYQALERRLGSGDVPPPSAGEYQIKAPDELKDAFQPEDPGFKEFLTQAHASGMTQKQMDATMQAFFSWAPKIMGAQQAASADECIATLSKVWTDETVRRENFSQALRGMRTFGGERFAELDRKYGNDPDFIWFAANVGKELKEDTSPAGAMTPASGGNVTELVTHPAYRDPKHPQHAQISAQVAEAFKRRTGGK